MGLNDIRVLTTTGAFRLTGRYHIFSIVRNNPERRIGAVGSLQDLNVAISQAKEKLFVVGSFEMMMNGWSKIATSFQNGKRNLSRKLAYLIDRKYGQIVHAPYILVK